MPVGPPTYFLASGFLEPMQTYAQNFEDVTLRRALPDIEQGFYVDIGGYSPNVHSVTRHFYEKNWRGINLEPNPNLFKSFVELRPRDINLPYAIGASRSTIDLHIISQYGGQTGLTTTMPLLAAEHQANGFELEQVVTVEMLPLQDLFDEYCGDVQMDFLKIDVEGGEQNVILPCGFNKQRPRIVLVENSPGYHEDIVSKGYLYTWFDGLNRWYVREEDEWRCELLARPTSLFDSVTAISNT